MISKGQQQQFARQASHHLFDFYLPFWSGPALDRKHGGWMGWLANDLKPDRTQPKGLIVHARILWTFSAAHRAKKLPLHREMAERAFDFLMGKFCDPFMAALSGGWTMPAGHWKTSKNAMGRRL
jgi:mannobiose 2-epimerase